MNTHRDAFGRGGMSAGSDDPQLDLDRLDRGGRPPSGWHAHTWINEVLADIGLLGTGQGSSSDRSRVEERSIRVLRERRCPLVVGDLADVGGTTRTVVAKAYRDDRGATTLTLLHWLSSGGLGRGLFRVTAGLGWSPSFRVLVTECAPGEAWSDLLVQAGPRLEIASAAVGGWLRTLQGVTNGHMGVRVPNRADYRAGADMLAQATRLGDQYPAFACRLEELTREALAVSAASAVRETTFVPSHGDLHPHNVHIDFREADVFVTALDLDTGGLRRPSYDVGYAVAQLLIMSVMRCGSFLPGAMAAEAFWSTVDDPARPGCADRGAVGAQVCRALVQSLHYELVTLRNGREDLLPAWCGVAEEALSDGISEMLGRLLRGWRP
ncbi:MAG: phosphotransferase [Nocardioidaceae bacterium]